MHTLRYTDKEAPLFFLDCFHKVRQMIDAFNDHYSKGCTPLWLLCINESMNTWLNKFCPGFMTLPCKPHPFRNKYHLIADSDGGKLIMWRIKILEGKDCPNKDDGTWAFPSKYERMWYSKTIDLLLDMTEPINRTGKVVTGNSGFCVVMGVMALQKFGVHGQFLIKNRKFWPKHVLGDYIDGYMVTKPLGYTETFVQEMEAQRILVHCTKDRDCITKIMSVHGVRDEIQDHATWRLMDGVWRTFKYIEPFSQHQPCQALG